MGAIRTLVTKLVLDADAALKGLKAYDKAWAVVATSVEATATRVERAAARASASLASVAAGAGQVAAGAGAGSRGPAAPRSGAAPKAAVIDKAIRAANIGEAARAGLAAGSQSINAATAALGPLATKADIAKAKIADLTAQVERNRKEMADLKRQTIETGDAEGKLAARSAGLAAANKDVAISLTQARRGLSDVRGGLIDNIKAAADLSNRFGVLKVAAGNMLSSGIQALGRGAVNMLEGAASSAMKFESGMADVAKVVDGLKTPTGEVTAEYSKMESKVLELSKTIAGPGAAGFAKIYAAVGWDPAKQEYTGKQEPVRWTKVHNLPDHVYFNHAQHVAVGKLECQECHGPIDEKMDVAEQWAPLTMGWCIDCHNTKEVKMAGNGYYDEVMARLEDSDLGHEALKEYLEDEKISVKELGGWECAKCHY